MMIVEKEDKIAIDTFSQKPAAVIANGDGLLVDSSLLRENISKVFFKRRGLDFLEKDVRALSGLDVVEAAQVIKQITNDHCTIPDILAEFASIAQEINYRGFSLMPGALEFIDMLPKGVSKVVISSSPSRFIDDLATFTGKKHLYEFSMSTQDVRRPKPFPDLYEEAIERLGYSPKKCFVFECTENGCISAKAAGAFVVGIPYFSNKLLRADIHFETLRSKKLRQYLSLWK